MELLVDAQNGDGADGRLGAVRAFPVTGAGVVGDKSLLGFAAQGFDGVGVGEVAVADGGHGGGEEGIPIEDDIASPGDAPDAADGGEDAAVFRVVDGVPAEDGLDGVGDLRGVGVCGEGLGVGVARVLQNGLDFFHGEWGAGADADRGGEVGGEVGACYGCVERVSCGLTGAVDGGGLGLDFARKFLDGAGAVPEVVDGEDECRWKGGGRLRRGERGGEHHQVGAVVGGLQAEVVAFPGEA